MLVSNESILNKENYKIIQLNTKECLNISYNEQGNKIKEWTEQDSR